MIAKIAVYEWNPNWLKISNAYSQIWTPTYYDLKNPTYVKLMIQWVNGILSDINNWPWTKQEKSAIKSGIVVSMKSKRDFISKDKEMLTLLWDSRTDTMHFLFWTMQDAKETLRNIWEQQSKPFDTISTWKTYSNLYSSSYSSTYTKNSYLFSKMQDIASNFYIWKPKYVKQPNYWSKYYTPRERDYMLERARAISNLNRMWTYAKWDSYNKPKDLTWRSPQQKAGDATLRMKPIVWKFKKPAAKPKERKQVNWKRYKNKDRQTIKWTRLMNRIKKYNKDYARKRVNRPVLVWYTKGGNRNSSVSRT
jgi:hypothetical protein